MSTNSPDDRPERDQRRRDSGDRSDRGDRGGQRGGGPGARRGNDRDRGFRRDGDRPPSAVTTATGIGTAVTTATAAAAYPERGRLPRARRQPRQP